MEAFIVWGTFRCEEYPKLYILCLKIASLNSYQENKEPQIFLSIYMLIAKLTKFSEKF